MSNRFIFIVLLLTFTGCSLFGEKSDVKPSMSVITTPEGAELYTPTGEKIGVTPLSLTRVDALKYSSGEMLAFVVKKFGYLDREVVIPVYGFDEYKLTLTPLDENHFKQWVLRAYNGQTNEMTRKLLNIQGLLFLRKNDDAKKAIDEFSKNYETIAAAHTMLATLLIAEGKELESKAHLLRALSIDQNDETAQRLLRRLEGGKRE